MQIHAREREREQRFLQNEKQMNKHINKTQNCVHLKHRCMEHFPKIRKCALKYGSYISREEIDVHVFSSIKIVKVFPNCTPHIHILLLEVANKKSLEQQMVLSHILQQLSSDFPGSSQNLNYQVKLVDITISVGNKQEHLNIVQIYANL